VTAARVLDGAAAAAFLRDEWPALYTASPAATPFQSPGWCTAWLATAGAAAGAEPLIVTNGAAALALQRRGRTVEPLTSPWCDYTLPVGAGDPAALAALAAALEGVDGARVDEVPLSSPLAAALRARPGWRESAASGTALVHLPGRWAEPPAGGEHGRKLRRLRARGDVACVPAPGATALGDLVRLHRTQWAERPEVVAPFDDPVVTATYEAVTAAMGEEAVVWRLLLGGETLAAYLCFHRGDTCYAYRPAIDVAWFRLSPGHLLLRLLLAGLAARGVRRFDLMRGEYGYKAAYADEWRRNAAFDLTAGSAEGPA
jgi:CelD/BcsL family acetyltransferase involved in cellulose biosynthesis